MTLPEFATPATETPGARLRRWLEDAQQAGQPNHTAMALSTLDAAGAPRTRFVLCKGITEAGIHFYTNLESDKGLEIARDPRVSVAFYWAATGRQVRLEGVLSPLPDDEADAYFASRSRLSKVGAWASDQSRPVPSRDVLLAAVEAAEARFPDAVPRPPHWSGFHLHADRWEFWEDQPGRIHDRWVLVSAEGTWMTWRLQP